MKYVRMAAGACAGAMLAASATAQDFTSQYEPRDEVRVGLRWSVPFGNRRDAIRRAKTVSLSLNQRRGDSYFPTLDVFTVSFADRPSTTFGDFETFYAAAEGEDSGGLFSTTRGKVLLGVGAALIVWGVVEATDDDDNGDIVCITEPCN